MKRDMDLVRDLLIKIADSDSPPTFSKLVPGRKDGTSEYAVAAYHMRMLVEDAGFVRGIDYRSSSGDEWLSLELTWQGQDFLENVRDPVVWKKTKDGLQKVGGASWDLIRDLGKAYAKLKMKEVSHVGISHRNKLHGRRSVRRGFNKGPVNV